MTSTAPSTDARQAPKVPDAPGSGPAGPGTRRRARDKGATRLGPFIFKVAMLALLDALGVLLIMVLAGKSEWVILGLVVVGLVVINVIYLRKGLLPGKYLTPGIAFLLIFQIFTIGYTGYIAFTNYSSGHVLDKQEAVQSVLSQNQTRVEKSPSYPLTVVTKGNELGFVVTDPKSGDTLFGTTKDPLHSVDAKVEGGQVSGLPGWKALNFSDLLKEQDKVFSLSVPVSDDAAEGSLRTQDGRTAYEYSSSLAYDKAKDTITDSKTGAVYTDRGHGAFETAKGQELTPGWRINVGFDNFTRAFTDQDIRGPLLKVTAWTVIFALVSVVSTFILGMFLAVVFNRPGMRGRKIYRAIMVLPYAFPAFLAAMVFAGMFSKSYGFFNQVMLGGAHIPWLEDPTLAKAAVLLLNLWLGFPYMFLVCMGALQSIPDEVEEAARMDGASAWQTFRHIKFPLLLVSVAPLLISSFAFNFNNFNLIYMLTGGGPRDMDASIPVGETDILISLVYKVAFTGQSRDYGLASAFSIIIFIIVAAISIVSFRRTKALEEVN
jgi:arabinogalactan oligomer/maltooligosaccharide transport system permease protein